MDDSRRPDETPETVGTVRRLYWALDLPRQRQDGPWERVPALGLREVESTEVDSVDGFSAYCPEANVDTNGASWRHIGWIALLEVDDHLPNS
jgi:hypothetical protein